MTKTILAAYDDQAIWGIGATERAALADAEQYLSDETDLSIAPMTKALAVKVERSGGNVAFRIFRGVLMTADAAMRAADIASAKGSLQPGDLY